MSQTVTGVQAPAAIGRIDGHTNYASKSYSITSGVTINAGDFVYFASGYITNTTVNGARILGMAEGTATGTATGTGTVLVCIDRNMQYLVKTAAALTISNSSNAYLGTYFDLSGTTGNQIATYQGTTTGQLLLVGILGMQGFPSFGISGLTNYYGIFVLVSSALNPYVSG